MQKIYVDPKYTKTYKTEANLDAALEKLNLPETISIIVIQIDGRFTALFNNLTKGDHAMYIQFVASKGFKVVG